MQKQNKLQELRTQLQRQTRRNNLNQMFKEHRHSLLQQHQKHNELEFNNLYPLINQDNLEQHLTFILNYSYNQQYNYRLVVLAGYLYDYLVTHRDNLEVLQILESLSQFEEIQIPQTEEFAAILIDNLNKHSKTVLSIIDNLLQHYKYCSALRDYLIELQFAETGEQAFLAISKQGETETKQLVLYLYFDILCIMISTHPMLDDSIFQAIITKLQKYSQEQNLKNVLFLRLELISSSGAENTNKATIIYQAFEELMITNYFDYQEEISSILHYCLKSKIPISKKFSPLLAKSLNSSLPNMKQKIIILLDVLGNQQNNAQLISNNEEFLLNLMKIFENSQEWMKKKTLQFLSKIIREYLLETDNQQMVAEIHHTFILPQICLAIKDSLQSKSKVIEELAIDLSFNIISTVTEQNLSCKTQILAKMEQQGIFDMLATISPQKDQLKKVQFLLSCFSDANQFE